MTKLEEVENILNELRDLIREGISLKQDGDLSAYELVGMSFNMLYARDVISSVLTKAYEELQEKGKVNPEPIEPKGAENDFPNNQTVVPFRKKNDTVH